MTERRKVLLVLGAIFSFAAAFLATTDYFVSEVRQMNFPDPATVPREQWGRRIPFINESVSGELLFLDRDRDFVVARLASGVQEMDFGSANELKIRKWKKSDRSMVCFWFPSQREYVVGCMDEPNEYREMDLQKKIIEIASD